MIFLYIGIAIIIIILCLLFLFTLYVHKKIFGMHWQKDKCVDYYSPSDFDGLTTQEWQFNLEKETLKGEIYSYGSDIKGIVVFAHGMWSGMISYTQEMEYFARNGYKVYGFNYEGTDTSTGKNVRGLANSLRCLDCAIKYIKQREKSTKIYVCGHSWGAFASINIAKYHPDLSAVCGLAPFASLKTAYNILLPKSLKFTIPFLLTIDRIKCGKYAAANAKTFLQETNVPTLIVHSKDDYLLKYDSTTKVLQETVKNDKISYLIVEGRGHNPDYTKDAIAYMKETSKKLNETPDDKKKEYKKSLDYKRMGALDSEVMDSIVNFFSKH